MHIPISPTVRRRRLARELRRMREARNLKLAEAAKESKVPLSTISSIENATARRIKARDIDALADLYGASTEERASLHKLTQESKETGWWSSYRDVFGGNALPDFESEASMIRKFEGLIIPGLFQTPEYAAAVFYAGRALQEHEVKRRVEARLARREILNRIKPPHVTVIIDEGALRRTVGAPSVMYEQLIHLSHMALRHHIDIQVLPYEAGAHLALAGSFTILDFPEFKDQSIIHVETAVDSLFLDGPEELDRYNLAFNNVQSLALAPAASGRLITDMAQALENKQ